MKRKVTLLLLLFCIFTLHAQGVYKTDKDFSYVSDEETDAYRKERCKLDVYYPVDKKDAQAFEASALQQLEEMIRIHRNHPSIVAWSMCNEAFFSAPEAMTGVRRLLKRMVDLAHQLDATRPAAVGEHNVLWPMKELTVLETLPDIMEMVPHSLIFKIRVFLIWCQNMEV